MKVIDLFAGCGGMSEGFLENNYEVQMAIEIDKNIAKTYALNHPNTDLKIKDINDITEKELSPYKDVDVIIGGPPCQGFSMAGARIRNGFIDDPRNYLFKGYFNILKTIKPKYFILENVTGLLTIHNGGILKEIIKSFSNSQELGGDRYYLHYRVMKVEDLGVPQKRERLIIVGSLNKDFDFDVIYKKTYENIIKENKNFFNKTTIKDAIGDLPSPTNDGIVKLNKTDNFYQKKLRNKNGIVKNHKKTKHSEIAIERMKKIKQGENFLVLKEDIKSVHSGSYGRMEWDSPSMTVTTRFDTPAGGRFIHPIENRTITPREAARIQGFRDDFEFIGPKTSICKQIGNAVPPKLSFFLSEFIKQLNKEK